MATSVAKDFEIILMEGIAPNSMASRQVIEKKARPQEQLNCPRCTSTNTKFCYYNNYSLTQPRYFCKTCRRYWTEGGSLRNVPVGGGSRKNKNKAITTNSSSSSSTPSSNSSSKVLPDLNPPTLPSSISSLQNPKMHGGQDLNLAFSPMENYHHVVLPTTGPTTTSAPLSALELLRSSMASRGLNMNNNDPFAPSNNSSPLMPNSNALYYPSGFPMQEIKTTSLGFSVDQQGNIGNRPFDQERGNLFPFGDVNKQLSTGEVVEHSKEQQGNSSGYWSGMIGEGSW